LLICYITNKNYEQQRKHIKTCINYFSNPTNNYLYTTSNKDKFRNVVNIISKYQFTEKTQ